MAGTEIPAACGCVGLKKHCVIGIWPVLHAKVHALIGESNRSM